ncbi:MAG: hypothetical protein AAF763_01875 [Pseudomonadota bacterium]
MTLPPKGERRPNPMAYGAAIPAGLGVNLLYAALEPALRWQAEVLEAQVLYWEDHFAILRRGPSTWFAHSDWAYRNHPMTGAVQGTEARGAGAELRIYGLDPDAAEARARAAGTPVLAGALDKPHGLRESYLLDPEGYVWVPGVPAGG